MQMSASGTGTDTTGKLRDPVANDLHELMRRYPTTHIFE